MAYWLAAEPVGAAETAGSVSTVKSTYKFHKYADLYPLASEEELSRLAEDIKKNGLANPITLHEGQILDGRNRYIACQSAKVKPHFSNWDCLIKSWANGEKDVLLWVISKNSHRRHLSTSQLAMVAAKVAEIFEEDAKKRQLATLKKGDVHPDPVNAILQEREVQGTSNSLAAKVVGGVSERTVCDAVKVQKASPELAAKVLAGDITVAQAKKELSPAPPSVAVVSPRRTRVEKVLHFINSIVGPISFMDTASVYLDVFLELEHRLNEMQNTLGEQGSV